MTLIANLTKEELDDLKWCLGEYIRVCREQKTNDRVAGNRYIIAQSLLKKLVEDQII